MKIYGISTYKDRMAKLTSCRYNISTYDSSPYKDREPHPSDVW